MISSPISSSKKRATRVLKCNDNPTGNHSGATIVFLRFVADIATQNHKE